MKVSVISAAVVAAGLLFGAQAQASEALAKKNNCLACHTVSAKVVGPSYKEVAAKYKGKNAEAMLADKIKKGGSGVWGAVPMPPNAAVSDADAKALAKWILSL